MKKIDPERAAAFRFDRGPIGCLLTHGFTGSPFVLRELGEYLAEKDITVSCKPLPGHGTTPEEMRRTDWRDWYGAVVENLAELSSLCDMVFLCGLSMGGTLSLHAAAHCADQYKVAGIVSYAAPIYMENRLFPLLRLAKAFMKYKRTPEPDVADPVGRAQVGSYDYVPLDCVSSLLELMNHVTSDLQDIKIPALLFHGKQDHTVSPPNVHLIHDLLGSVDKTVLGLENSYHVITVDYDKEIVKQKTFDFIRRVANLNGTNRS